MIQKFNKMGNITAKIQNHLIQLENCLYADLSHQKLRKAQKCLSEVKKSGYGISCFMPQLSSMSILRLQQFAQFNPYLCIITAQLQPSNTISHIAKSIITKMDPYLPSPFTLFPPQLLQQISQIFWKYEDTPLCYPEVSHRSPQYARTNEQSVKLLREYYSVPENYHILYMPIDCGQPSIPFNLNIITNNRAFYVTTDRQSQHAYNEAVKLNPATVKLDRMEDRTSVIQPLGQPFYFYTFYSKLSLESGQLTKEPQPLDGQILVCSLTNCCLYQKVDISKHGIIFFQTGRGLSLSGMNVLIIRNDLIGRQLPTCPNLLCYEKIIQKESVLNTPNILVPLMIREQISMYLAEGTILGKMADVLREIKEEYEAELAKYTEVRQSQAEGMVIFKLPAVSKAKSIKRYGFVKDDWLSIILQPANKGKESFFCSKLFQQQPI